MLEAAQINVPKDWLNDGAKGFLREGFKRLPFMELSNLSIWTPEPAYMLAMKCMSARWDSSDADDVRLLISHLQLSKKEEVFEIIQGFYPKEDIPARTQFFIEEILD